MGFSLSDLADYVPGVSNVKGAYEGITEGDWGKALGQGAFGPAYVANKKLIDAVAGLASPEQTNPTADVAGPSAAAALTYGEALAAAGKAGAYQGPREIIPTPQQTPSLDTTSADYNVTKGSAVGYDPALATATTAADKISDVNTKITAPTLAPAPTAVAGQIAQTDFNPSANAARDQQLAAIQAMQNAPSAATAMYQQALQQTAAQQMGMVNQARGAERAGMRREAMLGLGTQAMNATQAAAAASATEEQAKRAAALQGLYGLRGQDIGIATQEYLANVERMKRSAELSTDVSKSNAELEAKAAIERAKMGLTADTSTVEADLAQQRTKAAAITTDATLGTDISKTNAGAITAAGKYVADTQNKVGENYTTALNDRDKFIGTTRVAQGTVNTDRENRAAELAKAANDKAIADNAANELKAQELRQTGTTAALGQATNATNTQMTGANIQSNADTANADREQKGNAALIGAGGTLLAGAITSSDERVKRDIRQVSTKDLLDFADAVNAVTFRYKPGTDDGGANPHAGVLAQDLEKTKFGDELVRMGPDGVRKVDYNGLAALMAAAAAKALRKGAR